MQQFDDRNQNEENFWLAPDEEGTQRYDRALRGTYQVGYYEDEIRTPGDVIPELLLHGVLSEWPEFLKRTGLAAVLSEAQQKALLQGEAEPTGALLNYLVSWIPGGGGELNIGALINNRDYSKQTINITRAQSATLMPASAVKSAQSELFKPTKIELDWASHPDMAHTPYRAMLNTLVAEKLVQLKMVAEQKGIAPPTEADIRRKVAYIINSDVWGLEGFMPLVKMRDGSATARLYYQKSAAFFAGNVYDILVGASTQRSAISKEAFTAAAANHFSRIDKIYIREAQQHGTPKQIGGVLRTIMASEGLLLANIAKALPHTVISRAKRAGSALREKFVLDSQFSDEDLALILDKMGLDSTTRTYLEHLNSEASQLDVQRANSSRPHWLNSQDVEMLSSTQPSAPLAQRIERVRDSVARILKEADTDTKDPKQQVANAYKLYYTLRFLQKGVLPEIGAEYARHKISQTQTFWVRNRKTMGPSQFAEFVAQKPMAVLVGLCCNSPQERKIAEKLLLMSAHKTVISSDDAIKVAHEVYDEAIAEVIAPYLPPARARAEQAETQPLHEDAPVTPPPAAPIPAPMPETGKKPERVRPAAQKVEENWPESLASLRQEVRRNSLAITRMTQAELQSYYIKTAKKHVPQLYKQCIRPLAGDADSVNAVLAWMCIPQPAERWEMRLRLAHKLPLGHGDVTDIVSGALGISPQELAEQCPDSETNAAQAAPRDTLRFMKRTGLSAEQLEKALAAEPGILQRSINLDERFPGSYADKIAELLGIPESERPLFARLYCGDAPHRAAATGGTSVQTRIQVNEAQNQGQLAPETKQPARK